jgi:hypothetical protein
MRKDDLLEGWIGTWPPLDTALNSRWKFHFLVVEPIVVINCLILIFMHLCHLPDPCCHRDLPYDDEILDEQMRLNDRLSVMIVELGRTWRMNNDINVTAFFGEQS